jgi:hypothetical protein
MGPNSIGGTCCSQRATARCQPASGRGPPFLYSYPSLFLPPASIFFLMWSTPPHWLQHMPALPRLLLKTSNTHNF